MHPSTDSQQLLAPLLREEQLIQRLRSRLGDAAAASGLLDVAWRAVDSPFGQLLLAATPTGLVRVAFEQEDHDRVLVALAGSVGPRVLEAPRQLDDAARQLDAYFAGRLRSFNLPLDTRLVRSDFHRSVIRQLAAIPYGSTQSYRVVATSLGNPGASRAVGTACATNPLPLVVPCHRVVRTDGSIGQYLGGTDAKRRLLELEDDPHRN